MGLPASCSCALLAASPRLVRAGLRSRRLRGSPAPGGSTAACWPGLNCGTWPRTTAWLPESARRPGTSPAGFADRVHWAGRMERTTPVRGRLPRSPLTLNASSTAGLPAIPEGAATGRRRRCRRGFGRRQDRRGSRHPCGGTHALAQRLRADWLPPSVMNRWGRMPRRPSGPSRVPPPNWRQAAARSWRTVRDGLRRLRQG